MRATCASIRAQLPSGTGWDYGGFPYGLEPLTLPPPDAHGAWASGSAPAREADYAASCRRLLPGGDGPALSPVAAHDAGELCWFRWITGHQVTFVVWRLMADVAGKVGEGRLPAARGLPTLQACLRGYCAMLLYSGSCPRGVYETVIRPAIQRHHRGLSGGWAADYAPVRELFRGRCPTVTDHPQAGELRRALELCHLVHAEVAARLVPSGRSLLQEAGPTRQDPELLQVFYDLCFMTLRGPVTQHELLVQLLRRLTAVAQDLRANGLHPPGTEDPGPAPPELRRPEVVACELSLPELVHDLAAAAVDAATGPRWRDLRLAVGSALVGGTEG